MPTTIPDLTDAERSSLKKSFDDVGYCVVPDLFEEEELQEITDFFEAYKLTGGRTFDGGTSYEEIDITQRQVRAMHPHRYSEKAKGWLLHPNLADVLTLLLGREPLAVQSMYYFKPPGARGQGMHQDNFYLLAKPATCIGTWTALDAADLENGCLWVVPGSNRGDLHCPDKKTPERWMNYGDSHIDKFPRDQKPVPVEVPRGGTMFFSGNLIHGSGPNRTKDRCRRTLIGHYIDDASEQVASFYHPVLNMRGETVTVASPTGGGPCGDGWLGATH